MKTSTANLHMGRRLAVSGLALLIMLVIGTALAAVPSTTAYHFSSHPMISGTVVSVNDHQMVVDTDQGEQVTLEVDSRTMAPRDFGPGMVMRAEFVALEDCRFHAERIIPIRGGMSTQRLQAYANTRDSQETIARNASAGGSYRWDNSASPASVDTRVTQPQTIGEHSPGTIMTATPTTADYQFSTHPSITGRVASVNDHLLVIQTDQGQQVGLVMDSRTMVPGEVEPGSVLRVEFKQLKDGRYYAQRVSRIGPGVVDREQAYAHTRDSDAVVAQYNADCGCVKSVARNTETAAVVHRESVVTPEPYVAPAAAEPVAETLPQTASRQPLLLLLGLSALGSAGIVTVVRGLRAV